MLPLCSANAHLQTCARFGFWSTAFARRKASHVLGQKACPHFARTHLVSCARSVFAPLSLRSPKSSRARPATTQYATQGGGAALTIYRPRHLCRGVGVCARFYRSRLLCRGVEGLCSRFFGSRSDGSLRARSIGAYWLRATCRGGLRCLPADC